MNLQLKTELGDIETYDDSFLALTYQLEDLSNLNTTLTGYSKQIKIPGTKQNNIILGALFEVTSEGNFNLKKKLDVQVVDRGELIFSGFIRLIDVSNNLNKIEYTILILSNDLDFWDEIKGKKFNDIYKSSDLFSQFNHWRGSKVIVNSFYNHLDINSNYDHNANTDTDWNDISRTPIGYGYVYPYIDYGVSQTQIAVNINYNPALFVKQVIDNIFDWVGVNYKSDFFNSEYFRRLIIPYNKPKIDISDEEKKKNSVIAGVNLNQAHHAPYRGNANGYGYYYSSVYSGAKKGQSWIGYRKPGMYRTSGSFESINFNGGGYNGAQWNGTVFTAHTNGLFDIDIHYKVYVYAYEDGNSGTYEMKYLGNSDTIQFRWRLMKKRGSTTTVLKSSGSTAIKWTPAQDTNLSNVYWSDLPACDINASVSQEDIQIGDQIWFEIDNQTLNHNVFKRVGGLASKGRYGFDVISTTFGPSPSPSYFSITPNNDVVVTSTYVDMNKCIDKSISIEDFLKSLNTMFNLIWKKELYEGKDVIRIEPRNEYFNEYTSVLDWNDILNNDDDLTYSLLPSIEAKEIEYKYKKDVDYYNDLYQKTHNDKTYGTGIFITNNNFSKDIKKNELIFSPTETVYNYTQTSVPIISKFKKDTDNPNNETTDFNIRVLFWNGLSKTPIPTYTSYGGSIDYEFIIFPYGYTINKASMWLEGTNTQFSDTLEFDRSFNGGEMDYNRLPSTTPIRTLFDRFYREYIENITSPEAKELEAYFYLTPQDIANFDFRNRIYLKGAYWRVIKIIDYNPGISNTLTKVKLKKIVGINSKKLKKSKSEILTNCPTDTKIIYHIREDSCGLKYKDVIVTNATDTISDDCCKDFGGTINDSGLCVLSESTTPIQNEGFMFKIKPGIDNYTIKVKAPYKYNYNVFVNGQLVRICWTEDLKVPLDPEDPEGNIIEIQGTFPTFNNYASTAQDVIDIIQWGNIQWQDFTNFFRNMNQTVPVITATDVPDLSNVTSFEYALVNCTFKDAKINSWDFSNITSIYYGFSYSEYNAPLNNLDVSNVTNMERCFYNSDQFVQDISNWCVGNVINHSNFDTNTSASWTAGMKPDFNYPPC